MNLSEYGYCLEEYEYIFDLEGNLVDISYNRYNENKKPVMNIGVSKKGNICIRNLVRWPQTNNGEANGVLNDIVPEMKLYLDTANKEFNFDNIIVYSYGSANIKTEDEYEISLKLGKKNISVYEDISHIAVYDKSLNMLKVYGYTEDGNPDYSDHIEDVRVTDFGVITEEEDGNIYIMHLDNTVDIYEFEKKDDPIECLQYFVKKIQLGDGSEVDIEYDNFNMVRYVSRNNDEQLFRHETVEDNEEPKTYIASFYPTIITQNYDNFRYKYGDIWNLDILTLELRENCKYHTTYFTRSVFVITGDKDKMNEELKTVGKPILL